MTNPNTKRFLIVLDQHETQKNIVTYNFNFTRARVRKIAVYNDTATNLYYQLSIPHLNSSNIDVTNNDRNYFFCLPLNDVVGYSTYAVQESLGAGWDYVDKENQTLRRDLELTFRQFIDGTTNFTPPAGKPTILELELE
jgi:hypothetical protein